MPIISLSPHGIICSFPRLLPFLPAHLFFLIIYVGCASLFPCSLCLDAQYQYCQNITKCRIIEIQYPFSVGNRGCGLPSFQISCLQNSSFVIPIRDRNYTILTFLPPTMLAITRGQNCQFLNHSINNPIGSRESAGNKFTVKATENLTLYVYKCKEQDHLHKVHLPKCTAGLYYSFEKENSTLACSMEQLPVYTALIQPDHVLKDESCTSCEASHGICGYNCVSSVRLLLQRWTPY